MVDLAGAGRRLKGWEPVTEEDSAPVSGAMALPSSSRPRFTLLGLLLVLTAITAVSTIGVPWWFGRAEVTLQAAAELLVEDLQDLQNRAALRGTRLELRFAEDGTGYVATTASGTPLKSHLNDGPFQRDYPRDAVFRGVAVTNLTLAKGKAIAYSRSGECLTPARVELGFQGERVHVTLLEGAGVTTIESGPLKD